MRSSTRAPLALFLALALAATAAAQDAPPAPTFAFSEGPLARAWALVDPEARPASLAALRLPPGADPLPVGAQVWSEWAHAVKSATHREESVDLAGNRLWLAVFARDQDRYDDAWEHLAHAGGDPAGLAAVLPRLVPGAARDDLAAAAWPALPDGALLAPALPPPDRPAREVVLGTGRPRPGWASVEGFRVGAATLSLRISVESDGVQVDLRHLSGASARVRVLLPEAPDFELRSEYVDWLRQEDVRQPRELVLEPGTEPHTLFGRFRARKLAWPTQLPAGPNAQLEGPGLRLVAASPDELRGFAQGLLDLLGFSAEVAALDASLASEPWSGISLDFADPALRAAKLAGIVSLAERYVLARGP